MTTLIDTTRECPAIERNRLLQMIVKESRDLHDVWDGWVPVIRAEVRGIPQADVVRYLHELVESGDLEHKTMENCGVGVPAFRPLEVPA